MGVGSGEVASVSSMAARAITPMRSLRAARTPAATAICASWFRVLLETILVHLGSLWTGTERPCRLPER